MILTCEGFNKYIACDYWDIKLKKQYLENKSLKGITGIQYINLFFLWDYVNVQEKEYVFKPFWEKHDEKIKPTTESQIQCFINKVDEYTERRGIFMLGMLRMAQDFPRDYEMLRNIIFTSKNVYSDYLEVLESAGKLTNGKSQQMINILIKNIKSTYK